MPDRIVIGIAGGTGSGKTTIAKKLIEAFSDDCAVLSHDFYYKANEGMSFEERAMQNYDHPNSLDTDLMVEHLSELKMGKTITHPTYDFSNHARRETWQTLESSNIIIVEGILIFESEKLRDLIDVKLFVDTDADVRFIRRLTRDVKMRGRTIESVIEQWLTTVKPMHEQFVEPSKRYANLIIPEGGHNKVAVDMIINGINKILREQKSKMKN
ncbi:MAG TPA: uridine kinase [Eubacteriales bacterium]|nr:uridine kinase [Eubacteriales bacterium]